MRGTLLVSFFLCSVLAVGAENHYSLPSNDNVPIEQPLRRPKLGLKFGKVSLPISGLDEEAQAFFNQGVAAVHGFWIFEGERNFREVIKRHPKNPMGYAFAAYAQMVFGAGDFVRGGEYMAAARAKLAMGGVELTEPELLWIEAIGSLYDTRIEKKEERQKKHIQLLRDVMKAGSNEDLLLETGNFLALGIWSYQYMSLEKDAPEAIRLRQEMDQLIEKALAKSPEHPVHHYKIHLWNENKNDILARKSAQVCGQANASCAHLWHMPSHIFSALKEYRNGAYHFEAALRVDNKYLAENALGPQVIHNYAHNTNFYLDVLSDTGGVDRALRAGIDRLKGPRFFQAPSGYHDPTDGTVLMLINLLEEHQLWEQADSFYGKGYFAGLFDRAPDQENLARLTRFLGRIAAERGRLDDARTQAKKLQEIRRADYSNEKKKELIQIVEKLEKDLTFWIFIAEQKKVKGTIPKEVLSLMTEINISSKSELAQVALDANYPELALELAKAGADAKPSSIVPRVIYTQILLATGKEEQAVTNWKSSLPLIHIPQKLDESENLSVSVESAFPLLGLLKSPKISFQVNVLENSQHSLTTWRKAYGEMSPLGPYDLPVASAAVGANHKGMWESLSGEMTAKAKERLLQKPKGKEWLLLIFRQKADCPKCNAEQQKLLEKWVEPFQKLDVEPVIIRPDKPEKSETVSVLGDESLATYKAFGVYDEFTEQPSHGVFLIHRDGEIRWNSRTQHAFDQWEKLLKETERLQRIWD